MAPASREEPSAPRDTGQSAGNFPFSIMSRRNVCEDDIRAALPSLSDEVVRKGAHALNSIDASRIRGGLVSDEQPGLRELIWAILRGETAHASNEQRLQALERIQNSI